MSANADSFDAVVVGGGPAGSAAAIHLASGGARVLLAEQERFPREKLCGEFISPECLTHFARLGVLEEMSGAGGAQIHETFFYAQSGRGVSVPSEWFSGPRPAALGLSRAEMDARLLARSRAVGVEVLEGAGLSGLLVEGGRVAGVRLTLEGGGVREARARVTVDATGRQRAVARRGEREARRGAFGPAARRAASRAGDDPARSPLVAFKAHLSGASPRPGVCEIYFYRGGYGGLSEVEGGLANLCFIASAEDVRARGSDAERVVREVLMRNRRAAETLSCARAETRWLGVALRGFGRYAAAPAPGLLAVGDAAAFIDPFTGSGMLMALESAELAARIIAAWLPAARAGTVAPGPLAREYERLHAARFGARLRVCRLLRGAAFAPAPLTELAVRVFSASRTLRRGVARATRPRQQSEPREAHGR
ncbi:MAG TPA: FAD-dependent monooxygenase [Pyrinomonadaceae bacterium]|nr:FAD-dependent monooxygenase [Pyrinomonadaceae bacterium]